MKTRLHEALAVLTAEQLNFDPILLEKEEVKMVQKRVYTQVVYLTLLLLGLTASLIGCVGLIRSGVNFGNCIVFVAGVVTTYFSMRKIGRTETDLNTTQKHQLSVWRKVQTLMKDVSGLFDDCDNVNNLKAQIDSMARYIVSELKETPRVDLILTDTNPCLDQKRFNLDTLIRLIITLRLFGSDRLDYPRSTSEGPRQREQDDEETLICLITKRILENPTKPILLE